jgi:hypothetical protein
LTTLIWIALSLRHARALLANDEQAARLFEEPSVPKSK